MTFSARQPKNLCRTQSQPHYLTFEDPIKVFDAVSMLELCTVSVKIGYTPTFLKHVMSFHEGRRATANFDGALSDSLEISRGIKQSSLPTQYLFSVFLAALQYVFMKCHGVLLLWKTEGSLFNLVHLREKPRSE